MVLLRLVAVLVEGEFLVMVPILVLLALLLVVAVAVMVKIVDWVVQLVPQAR